MAKVDTTVRVTSEHVRYWLRQFRTDEEVECALRMATAIKIIGRGDIHSAVHDLLALEPALQGAYLSSAASPRDSGGITSYYAGDLASGLRLDAVTLPDALSRADERPIIFVEDFVGSGGQIRSTLLKWFGKTDDPRTLDEYHGDPLCHAAQQSLRSRRLVFSFAAGREEGGEAIRVVGKELELNISVHIAVTAERLPRAFADECVEYPNEDAKKRFRERCEDIGGQLLNSPGGPRDKEKIPDRVLGYGNQAFLVAFPYNVPTQTLTLIWAHGTVDGYPWMPLLPRRKK